jgi:hypothetical protein
MSEHRLFKSKDGLIAIVGDVDRREVLHVEDKAAKELVDLINKRREIGVQISHLLRESARGPGADMLGDDDDTVVCARLRKGL